MNLAATNSFIPHAFSSPSLNKIDQEFRQWICQYGHWSENVERLFIHLAQSNLQSKPVTNEQKKLLWQAAEDALNGVDFVKHYPALFRDLLQNAALRSEFVTITDNLVE
jgi:hypothetical protein